MRAATQGSAATDEASMYLAVIDRKGRFVSLLLPCDFDESDLDLHRSLSIALATLQLEVSVDGSSQN
ncbi:MAG: hypothetical protein ACREP9_06550 [Candidatus Dormibacteraceae bacterium]